MVKRCLHCALRIVNTTISVIGVLMIIYSLWALKKWKAIEATSSEYGLLYPWFIFAFLAIGIAIFFSMLCGAYQASLGSAYNIYYSWYAFLKTLVWKHLIVSLELLLYIIFVCSILFLEVGVVIFIFFKDWVAEINVDYTGQYTEFEEFVTFHLTLCRYLALLIVLLQAVGFVLALMLWTWLPEPSACIEDYETPRSSLKQSFLICNDSQPSVPSPLTSNADNGRRTLVEEIG